MAVLPSETAHEKSVPLHAGVCLNLCVCVLGSCIPVIPAWTPPLSLILNHHF